MKVDFDWLRREFDVYPTCVLTIGANEGQEVRALAEAGIAGYHIEAIPSVFAKLSELCDQFDNQVAVQACLDEAPGNTVEFNIASNSQSSSLLPLGRVPVACPHVSYTETIRLETTTVDGLLAEGSIPSEVNFAVIDVQGAEARVLRGGGSLLQLPSLWGVLIEVSLDPIYEGGATFLELYNSFLQPAGFHLKKVNFNRQGWADALFLKRWWMVEEEEVTPLGAYSYSAQVRADNIAPLGRCSQSSLSKWSAGPDEANRAVSEPLTGTYAFHTDFQDQPWWQIDFGDSVRFDEIVVYNRLEAGRGRARNLIVEASDDGKSWEVIHQNQRNFGGVDGDPLSVECPFRQARYVRLRIPAETALHLDGVQIYTWKPEVLGQAQGLH